MSRSAARLILSCVLLAAPLHAQDATERKVDEAVAIARQAYGPPTPRKSCGVPDDSGDIVVCATDNSQYRVQSTAQENPRSREALNTGIPRAPNVSTLPDCSEGCISIGSVPPPVYYFDIKALPAAPAGSDADKIAKGEVPEG